MSLYQYLSSGVTRSFVIGKGPVSDGSDSQVTELPYFPARKTHFFP